MGITEWVLNIGQNKSYNQQYIINIENEIWLAFTREILHWKDTDVYAISFFVEFDIDDQTDVRLHFGYNTESQVQNELCNDTDNETVRWNYNFWLQNETFCFGDDGITKNIIQHWIKQQKLREEEVVEEFVKKTILAVKEIHKCGIIKSHFGTELPIIIHTYNYHENIAYINQQANGEYLDKRFTDYCLRDFEE